MINILNIILAYYEYEEVILASDSFKFYKSKDQQIANYLLLKLIDCRAFETNKEKTKHTLEDVEIEYSKGKNTSGKSLKSLISDSLNDQEKSQLDKNTSLIYLLQFNDMKNFNLHRNSVYDIEESPYYFKRYILPYTEKQSRLLNDRIEKNKEKTICDLLSDIANDKDEYYSLSRGDNIGSLYEFVICLFAKIPFLQYSFKAETAPKTLTASIYEKVKEKNLEKYSIAVQENESSLDALLDLEQLTKEDEEDIENDLNQRLSGEI